ncbi:MAG TPA: acetate kinase, partial [Chroococcidiopsis sp.]
MKILVLNAGSSSLKSCLYDITGDRLSPIASPPLWQGTVDWTHQQGVAELTVKTVSGVRWSKALHDASRQTVTAHLLETLWSGETQVIASQAAIDIVGHRVVHGGRDYQTSTRITPVVKEAIARLAKFAPIHNPVNLEGIEACEALLGDVPQVAVFDTAFHAHLPLAAKVYPGPYEWIEQGIQRYGFHGISHQYCAERAAQLLGRSLDELRLIVCHLGNGCSLSAIRNGHSVDTTMGFTPLEGLMMGTRSGSVDPGILIHLLRQEGYTADQLDQLLNRQSGIKGLSGVSEDVRTLLEAIASGNSRAQLALDVFIHRLRSCIGAMLPSLGGLDALVFTAGIGENSALVRAAACEGFGFLGIAVDPDKNDAHPIDSDIAT